ncbi:MAG: glycoside hydrolase [Planctomycetota bacterium]|nr:MAG: glycoside hydrolase [Planctomycetota bacterium]
MRRVRWFAVIVALGAAMQALPVGAQSSDLPPFPYGVPAEKPNRPLSKAMERAYTRYMSPTTWGNELFTKFLYSPLEGLDYHNGDGTVSRRDPSKVIKANGKYYVWYTHRATPTPPQGYEASTDEIPSTDWDLAEIWYATSEDGFVWHEQGPAVKRPPKPQLGWRSVCTPDVLYWKGKYYLYYQVFVETSGKRGDYCAASCAYADSPDGPWTPTGKVIIPCGPEGAWDQYAIHDPYPLVYKGKIYLYYKSESAGRPKPVRLLGLAIADDPLGPFEKHPLNPVLNSGHETAFFPFKEGIAAIVTRHGNEHNTIQYAPDGVNFDVAASVSIPPFAAGPYVPDAFTDSGNGRGITWGLCHFTTAGTRDKQYSILARFDCELSLDEDNYWLKEPEHWWPPEYYFHSTPNPQFRKALEWKAKEDLKKP